MRLTISKSKCQSSKAPSSMYGGRHCSSDINNGMVTSSGSMLSNWLSLMGSAPTAAMAGVNNRAAKSVIRGFLIFMDLLYTISFPFILGIAYLFIAIIDEITSIIKHFSPLLCFHAPGKSVSHVKKIMEQQLSAAP